MGRGGKSQILLGVKKKKKASVDPFLRKKWRNGLVDLINQTNKKTNVGKIEFARQPKALSVTPANNVFMVCESQ